MAVALSTFPGDGAATLDAIDEWVRSVLTLGIAPPTLADVPTFTAAVAAQRRRQSPNSDPSVLAAVQALQANPRCGVDLGAVVAAVAYSDQFTTVFNHLAAIVGDVRNAATAGAGAAAGSTAASSSRRAKFAQRATDKRLFTAHAGKIAVASDASRDSFGNARSSEHLLSADGACAGLRLYVLFLFSSRGESESDKWDPLFSMLQGKG